MCDDDAGHFPTVKTLAVFFAVNRTKSRVRLIESVSTVAKEGS